MVSNRIFGLVQLFNVEKFMYMNIDKMFKVLYNTF